MKGEQDDWVGPKRLGKYAHVRPRGKTVDQWEWWYCPSCFNAAMRATRMTEFPGPRICGNPHPAPAPGGALDYLRIEMQRLPADMDLEVFEAAWRVAGPDGIRPLLEAV